MSILLSPARALFVVVCALLLAACSTVTSTEGMSPEPAAYAGLTQNPQTVSILVSGEPRGITLENFEQALADAVAASQVFSAVTDTGDCLLEVRMHNVTQPMFAAGFTITIESTWKVFRLSDRALLWSEPVNVTYKGGAMEGGLLGANRSRVATERAARENIRQGIRTLGKADLD